MTSHCSLTLLNKPKKSLTELKLLLYMLDCTRMQRKQSSWHSTSKLSQWSRHKNLVFWKRFRTLRVRAFFHKTVRVCHVYSSFKIGFTCRITVIFGTLKDGSLLINTLASNICFSSRNMFQNGVDALSKIVDAFLSKSSKFYLVRSIR